MTLTLIWLIAFALLLFLFLKRWEASVSGILDALLPAVLHSEDDRWIWCPALAVLGATFIVRPVDMLFTVIVLALVALIGTKLAGWVKNKVDMH
ncbi:hypothetical protein [Halomonas daqiaonensis]|uniref:Uncharacterized protein n=1 Tax=Halomonas daqiaonensis TaxID=650850 RepID=A0A1H7L5S3_9GAMM|nr:hypothetical protein [Halomonas daqiaonensis]SEK93607.1 hypothetical protein SAMN04488129_105165 [Halomonas daqiaonensis]